MLMLFYVKASTETTFMFGRREIALDSKATKLNHIHHPPLGADAVSVETDISVCYACSYYKVSMFADRQSN